MKGKILSNYDTKHSVFVYHKNCDTIYSIFHFIITQYIKKSLCEPIAFLAAPEIWYVHVPGNYRKGTAIAVYGYGGPICYT